MPQISVVSGSFSCDGKPVEGWVQFTPSRLWVIQQGIPWACLAPTKRLDPDGSFVVLLTPTDTDYVPWHYLVDTPAGSFKILVPKNVAMHNLRELVDHPPSSW